MGVVEIVGNGRVVGDELRRVYVGVGLVFFPFCIPIRYPRVALVMATIRRELIHL